MRESQWSLLVRMIQTGKCTPFIGPQVYERWLPAPVKMAKEWADKYGYPLEDSHVLAKVAQFLELNREIPKLILSEELSKIRPPDFGLDQFKDTPYRILAEFPFPIYITTNYDYFMEKALKDKFRTPVSETCRWNPKPDEEEFELGTKKSKHVPTIEHPLVYHLHGVLDKPESMVLTEKDHINFIINLNKIEEKELLPPAVRTALAKSSLLFIGYGLEDITFRVLFQGISVLSNERQAINVAVQLEPSFAENQVHAENKAKLAQKYLDTYTTEMFQVQAYWGTADQFLLELREKWNKFRVETSTSAT